jgi:hypothetical protein
VKRAVVKKVAKKAVKRAVIKKALKRAIIKRVVKKAAVKKVLETMINPPAAPTPTPLFEPTTDGGSGTGSTF